MTACYIFNLVCVNFLYYKYEWFMPFISYTKARHFEWQAERGGEYARGKEGVTNRSPASFLPHPPLKKDVRSE